MTQAHTPAPWRIGDAGRTIFGAQSNQPAPVTVAEIAPESPRKSAAEVRANAQLIAAAPELLECSEALGAAIERGDPQDIADRWMNLKTAIAKARGVEA